MVSCCPIASVGSSIRCSTAFLEYRYGEGGDSVRVLVVGAGPLGSLMAARLHEAGQDVTVLARGQRLQDIREHGIVLESGIDGPRTVTRVKAVESLQPDDRYDLVMVVMRKNQAEQILPVLVANRNTPTILFMMNNFAGFQPLVEALGEERVMVGFPLPGGERIGHVMRIVPIDRMHRYTIPIGEPDGLIRDRTREVAAVLRTMEGYKVEIRQDMDAWLKYHVAALMPALVPAVYASGTSVERMARTRDAVVLAVRGMREAFRALEKAGVPMSPRKFRILYWIPEPLLVFLVRRKLKGEAMKISGEGHLKAAREEVESLTQEFRDFVRRNGIATPVIDSMSKWYEPGTPPLPDGSSAIPLRWQGLIVTVLALALIVVLIIIL